MDQKLVIHVQGDKLLAEWIDDKGNRNPIGWLQLPKDDVETIVLTNLWDSNVLIVNS